MSTKVRIIEYTNGALGHYEIQILAKEKYSGNVPAYTVIGSITWLRNIGENEDGKWYALTFRTECNMHHHDHLSKMGAIAKQIYANASSTQPDEVLAILQAEKHFLHCGQYYPESLIGQSLYHVMKGETHYANVVAPNEIVAAKLAKKYYSLDVVVFDHITSKN